jgi:ParB/RepB/Spo0J family partition protein
MSTTEKKPEEKKGAFSGVNDMMATGFDDFLTTDDGFQSIDIDLDDIEIVEQVRPDEDLEDDEQTLEDLGNSLAKHQIQNILVRPNPKLAWDPTAKRYELVVGGRRVAGGKTVGLKKLRGEVRDLTDDEVDSIQFAENIHRKNLSAKAEAKRVQKTVDAIGVEATLAKYNKGKSWLSKLLAMLTLPPETNRLVSENISADPEVIGAVKQIEKKDPAAAKDVVDKLKENKGKINQRDTVAKVKDKVAPSKAKQKAAEKQKTNGPKDPANVAKPADLSHQENGPVTNIAPATLANDPALQELQNQFAAEASNQDAENVDRLDTGKVPALPPVESLNNAYTNIFEFGSDPKMLLSLMPEEERENVENWLHSFYDAGVSAVNLAGAVLNGLRNGTFAETGHGAFALVAFLSGGEEGVKFNLLNIMGNVKKS